MNFKRTGLLCVFVFVHFSACDSNSTAQISSENISSSSENTLASSEIVPGVIQLIRQYEESVRYFHSEINSKFWAHPSQEFLEGQLSLSPLPEFQDPNFSSIGDVSGCGFDDDNRLDTYMDCELGYIYDLDTREVLVGLVNYIDGNKESIFREFTDAGERQLAIVIRRDENLPQWEIQLEGSDAEIVQFFWGDFTEAETGDNCTFRNRSYHEYSRATPAECALAIREAIVFLQSL